MTLRVDQDQHGSWVVLDCDDTTIRSRSFTTNEAAWRWVDRNDHHEWIEWRQRLYQLYAPLTETEMAFEHKDDSGSLWRNDRRETGQQPEYKGDGVVNGEPFWINAWVKQSQKTGKKYFSIAFKPKRERVSSGRSLKEDLGDEIGF